MLAKLGCVLCSADAEHLRIKSSNIHARVEVARAEVASYCSVHQRMKSLKVDHGSNDAGWTLCMSRQVH